MLGLFAKEAFRKKMSVSRLETDMQLVSRIRQARMASFTRFLSSFVKKKNCKASSCPENYFVFLRREKKTHP